MKKKFIALILAVIMTATCVGAGVLNSPDIQLVDVESGESVSTVEIPRSERSEIAVDYDGSDLAYQWQLSSDGKTWINVYGQTEESIKLSYAMVCNMLSDDGTAQVRCIVTDADNKYESNTAEVSFVEDKAVSAVDNSAAAKPAAPAKAALQRNKVAPTASEDEVKETIVVKINYLFEDGTPAANPWTATVVKGDSFAQDVKSPNVVGYKPDQETVHVDTSEGVYNYTVYYYPAEVNFTVKHYQQNVDNDNYTLVDTETKTGYTESPVGENLGNDYTGFYALLYDTTTKIAADGSTVVEIYYDREYYLLSLDLAGGYGSEPMYAKYGTPVSVAEPKRKGYDFTGWDPALPATIATNTKHTAQWKAPGTAKVTVVVWGENPDDEKYSYIKTATDYATPEQEFSYKTCTKEAHEHTAECGCIHYGTHSLIPSCYNVYGDAVDPDTFGDHDATAHFLHKCTETKACKRTDLSQYLVNGSVCHYRNGNGSTSEARSEHAYWLYLNGRYYSITKDQFNSFKTNTGDSIDHGNDTYEVYKGKTSCQHKHTDNCCTCGKSEHTHDSNCFNSVSFGMDSKLWKLADCDTVTVAADGSSVINVYYDRTEFTLHFRNKNSNSDDYGTIKAKWGANIRDEFNQKSTNAGTSNWSEKPGAGDPWTSYLDIMPKVNRVYYAYKDGYGTSTAYYYVEGLDGKDELFYKNVSTGTGYTVTKEEFIDITGFTFNASRSAKVDDDFDGAKFYYDRNSYKLKFFNKVDIIDGRTQTVKFEAPLSSYYFVPDYPSNLEPNAYKFAGWYTTDGCYAGSEADLSTMTMPASDVILYAKWVPKTHTVKTYLTKDAMDNGSDELQNWTVTHGSTVTDPPADPERKPYKFVGWFYDENGTEKAFDFSMPVNRDLNLYAKWSSNNLVEYKIHYQLKDGTEIAPDTTGSGLAGTTKTFDAKTGTQLKDSYQTGYFPQTGSHSLTFDIEGKNEFTFVYVPKEKVKYTVRYLDKATGEPVVVDGVPKADKVGETRDAVITEKFEYIKGYAPDAYQKKLVLSEDENKNVLIFWYTKDETHAPVQTIHWIQNIAGDGYTEYQSSTNLNGVIGEKYTATPISITGFKFNSIKSNTEGKLPETGLVLNLYYDRKECDYTFRFMEKGTNTQLAAPVTGTARYQAQVTESAKTIDGYTLVSNENQSITIGTDAEKNVKTFWYEEKTAVINYEVVGPEGCGSVSRTSETVNMVTGTANGSTATASNNAYKFVGWYSDEDCNNRVSSDAEYVPTKSGTLWPASTTYYAKFDWNVADLTITKTGAEAIDKNQSFIFHVTGEGKDMYVTVQGNGSVTIKGLTVGTYKVEEVTSWSWRYKPDQGSKNVEVKGGQKNEVTFNNSRTNGSWLSGDSCAINSVRGRH